MIQVRYKMEDFNGIVSLLVACIELGLLVNLLVFAEKNLVNKLVILLIGLLLVYQAVEFILCFVELQNQALVYLSLFTISFLPPLALFILFRFYEINSKYAYLIFIPAVYFVIYYLFYIDNLEVAKCTVLYAVYNYPLGIYYGSFYYLPVLISIIFLVFKLRGENNSHAKKLNIILLTGYIVTFLPGLLINLFVPGALAAVESILCKLALIFAVSHSLFVLRNREAAGSED